MELAIGQAGFMCFLGAICRFQRTLLPFFPLFLDLGVDEGRERGNISKETSRIAEKRLEKKLALQVRLLETQFVFMII